MLLDLYRIGLAAVDGRRLMREHLSGRSREQRYWLLAVGKSAVQMALGARDGLAEAIERALVVAPEGYLDPALQRIPGVECITAGHPLPDAASLDAGAAALQMVRTLPAGVRLLVLVSGGASSLIEVLRPGVQLDDLHRLWRESLAAGWDIALLNQKRSALSLIKGGGLAAALASHDAEAWFMSDVPGDDPALLGSGLLASPARREAPAAGFPLQQIAGLDTALAAIEQAAGARGLRVDRQGSRLAGEATAAAGQLCEALFAGSPRLIVAGGETTVRLPPASGRGGRCQHFALQCALHIEGRTGLFILAAGTDGIDGNSPDAGALVDGATVARARQAGLDPQAILAAADSGVLLEASGDLIHTGPTGTNVGDLVLALRHSAR